MHVIRGERVLQALEEDDLALVEDSTYSDLYQNIQRGFPSTRRRQHIASQVNVQNLTFTAFVPNRSFQVDSKCAGSEGNQYSQIVQFTDVNFKNYDDPSLVTFRGKDGKEYHIEPVGLRRKRLKVYCDCLDFHWRFKNYNYSDNSLIGRPAPPYVATGKRPPANPQKVPGFCKHIIKVFRQLRTNRVIK